MFRATVIIAAGIAVLSCFADTTPLYQLPQIDADAKPPFSYKLSPGLGNQVIISSSQIIRSGASNLSQLLNNIAGLQFISGLGDEPQILIHSEPALIMLDGIPLTNFSMSTPDVSLIPLSEIAEVIITTGTVGTEYGNQSLGGSINIITKNPAEAEHHLSVVLGLPLMSQVNYVASGPMDLHNAYRLNIQNEYDQGYRKSSQQSNNQAGLKLEHWNDTNKIELDVYGLHQTIHFPGYLTASEAAQGPTQSLQGQEDEISNTGLINLSLSHQFNQTWQGKTLLSYRSQQADINYNTGGIYQQNYQTVSINPELSGDLSALNRSMHSIAGLILSNETYNYGGPVITDSSINDASQQQYSGYGSINLPLIKKISLNTAGRVVAIDTHGQFVNYNTTTLNPPSSQTQQLGLVTVSLNDQFNDQTTGYIRRAMGYQLPFIDESNDTGAVNTGFGLKATTSTAYETGINWHNNQWQTDAELFLINLDNEIAYYSPPDFSPGYNYNLPPTHREGVSWDAQYEPTVKWTLRVSSTIMNNRFREGLNSGDEIPGASEILGSLSARYQLTPIWSVYAESQYTGPQYAEGDNANLSAAIPGYWLENIAVNAEFHDWLWSFRVDNLTNVQYNLATLYYAPDFIAYYPAAGRTAMMQITYKLS